MSGLVFSACIVAMFIVIAFLASLGAGKAMKDSPAPRRVKPPLHRDRMPADEMSQAEYAWRAHRGDDAS